jgi:hypothetical protein
MLVPAFCRALTPTSSTDKEANFANRHIWDLPPLFRVSLNKVRHLYQLGLDFAADTVTTIRLHMLDQSCTRCQQASTKMQLTPCHRMILAFCSTKLSVLFLYRRLLSRTSGAVFQWANNTTIALVCIYSFSFLFALIFVCTPISAFWERYSVRPPYTRPYRCLNNEAISHFAFSVINVVFDCVITVLPIYFLRRLSMARAQKWALCALFGVGFT